VRLVEDPSRDPRRAYLSGLSLMPTLEALARLVREAVEDVRREAQL
jgi:hypothetical protein